MKSSQGNDTLVVPTIGENRFISNFSIIYESVAIIVSPLIALMKNQVDVLNTLFEKKFASVFNSTLSTTEKNMSRKYFKWSNEISLYHRVFFKRE